MNAVKRLALSQLRSHPDNPRLAMNAEVMATILAGLAETGEMADEHALVVRRVEDGYQIVSGHHRAAAAHEFGLTEVPCWVHEMDNDEAHMRLALDNAQTGLKPLEIGLHALRHVPPEQGKASGGITAYAKRLAKDRGDLSRMRKAAEVYLSLRGDSHEVAAALAQRPYELLTAISKAPREHWAELCSSAVTNEWTVERARQAVSAIRADIAAQAEAEKRIADQEAAEGARWEALLSEPVAVEIDAMPGLSVRGKLAEYENRNRAYAAAQQVERERERKRREAAIRDAQDTSQRVVETLIWANQLFGLPANRERALAARTKYPRYSGQTDFEMHDPESIRKIAGYLSEYADLLERTTSHVRQAVG